MWSAIFSLLKLWLYSELTYYAYFRLRLTAVQKFKPFLKMGLDEIDVLSEKCIEAITMAYDDPKNAKAAMREFFCGWFKGCRFEDIQVENLKDYLAMHEHGSLFRELSKEGKERIMKIISKLEAIMEHSFPDGRNESLSLMCPSFEPVRAWYRPLIIYLIIFCAKNCFNIILRIMGFKPHFCGYLRYWAKKIPSSGKPKKDALVFLHGVSPGLLPYYTFLSSLIADEDRDVFLIELPWISMRAYTDFPPVKEYVRCIDIMLNYHNVESACFIGHSYGTIVCAWVLKHCPRLIKSLVLLDPVSLMLIDSSLAANFLHLRSMHSRRQKLKIFKLILLLSFYYISAREIGIAESLSRYLRWQESNIWFDELPSNTTVLLSSKDAIVPVKKVRNFIMNYNTQQHRDHPPKHLLWQDGMPHGGFLLSRPDQSQIIDCIRSRH